MAGGKARQRNRELTSQTILECALAVFSERGFEGATTREIAGRAEVNHAMIAFYYGNKEKLWRAAVEWLFAETARWIGDIDSAGSTDIERFRVLVRRYVAYSAKHPEHARLVVQESVRRGPRLNRIVALARRHHAVVTPLFGRLMDAGHILHMDPVSFAYIFSSACQSVFMLAHEVRGIYNKRVSSDEFVDSHAEAVIALFLRQR